MRSGSLTSLIVFKTKTITRDPVSNEEIPTWETWGRAYAEIEAKQGQEFFDGVKRHNQTVYHLTCRAEDTEGVTADMLIVDDVYGTLSIKAVLPGTRRRHVLIHATSGSGVD